jgi:TolA-binding protein
MTRRIALLFLFLLLCVSSAWPKFKEDEQKYLEERFESVLAQLQTLQNQIQTLNTQLQELRLNQARFQEFITRQQRQVQEIDQMVSSLRVGGEDHYSGLKAAIEKLRTEISKASAAGGGTAVAGGGTTPLPPLAAESRTTGYILSVEGDTVLVDMGSAQGIQQGTRLALYKASDPNTRVGVLEVTQVVDAGNSRARIITTINSGVKPEFSDVVRPEK